MNDIHPTAVVGPDVKLGTDNIIGPYVVIIGPCEIGDGNWFGPHVTVGGPPEVRDHPHLAGWHGGGVGGGVRIGNGNVLREFTCVHQPAEHQTSIGDDCYIMNRVYVPHDAQLCDQVTIASSVAMGGHVKIGTGANIGLGATVHQRRVVGPGSMVGMGGVVTRDVPPYAVAYGNPARVRGVNVVGMRRSGLAESAIDELARCYAEPESLSNWHPDSVPADLVDAFGWWRTATGAPT